MLSLFIKPVILAIVITLPVWIFVRIRMNIRNKRSDKKKSFTPALLYDVFYLYVMAVLAVTIIPFPLGRYKIDGTRGINLMPVIHTVKDFMVTISPQGRFMMKPALENIVGNLILFMPLGFLLPILFYNLNSLKKIITIALVSSLCIELIQLILRQFKIYRTVDIDDIILNVSGAIIGYFFYVLLLPLLKKGYPFITTGENIITKRSQ